MNRIKIIVLVCIGFSLSAFMYTTANNKKEVISERAPDFFYDVGSRYATTISKAKIYEATSILDIIPEQANWGLSPIKTVEVSIENNYFLGRRAISTDLTLNEEQIQILRSTQYADNLRVFAACENSHESYDLAYFLTVVPETQAYYSLGREAFLTYLKENSKDIIADVEAEKLQPGKIAFTINTAGNISKVELLSSSGYFLIDDRMLSIVSKSTGQWIPAKNSTGEIVEQRLVFSFGNVGC